jgi:hypothetical protein
MENDPWSHEIAWLGLRLGLGFLKLTVTKYKKN